MFSQEFLQSISLENGPRELLPDLANFALEKVLAEKLRLPCRICSPSSLIGSLLLVMEFLAFRRLDLQRLGELTDFPVPQALQVPEVTFAAPLPCLQLQAAAPCFLKIGIQSPIFFLELRATSTETSALAEFVVLCLTNFASPGDRQGRHHQGAPNARTSDGFRRCLKPTVYSRRGLGTSCGTGRRSSCRRFVDEATTVARELPCGARRGGS